jgi:hypothetical protein
MRLGYAGEHRLAAAGLGLHRAVGMRRARSRTCGLSRAVAGTEDCRGPCAPPPVGVTRSHPITAKASEGAYGLRPQDLRGAYFPGEAPDAPATEPQTIALVDSYDDPNAEADLKIYVEEFALPPCIEANRCFKKVNQVGETGPHQSRAANGKRKKPTDGRLRYLSTSTRTEARESAEGMQTREQPS